MNEHTEQERQSSEKKERGSEVLDWLQCIVTALAFCVILFTFFISPSIVVGSSMYPTLEEGDFLLITKHFYQPKYGDIVVLRKEAFKTEPIVKRVIATAGQTVDIDFQEGVVYVDGTPLDEPYVNSPTNEPESFTEPVTVPEGCIFVMGDNRNRSTDSRYEKIGCVDIRMILGKAILRVVPLNKFGSIYG